MKYPKVYVIILNYNGWGDTIECIESVLRNDYINYQVIVVDNNSPNNSMEYIKAWTEGNLNVWVRPDHPLRHLSYPPVKKPIPYVYYNREEAEKGGNQELEESLKTKLPDGITTKYPFIFIQAGENLGFAGGNNVGIRYALSKDDFEYIWLLNNDTVIESRSLSSVIKILGDDKIVAGSQILFYNNPSKIWQLKPMFYPQIGLVSDKFLRKDISQVNFSELHFVSTSFCSGCSLFVPKKALLEIGLLDEKIFLYNEDLDYSIRAKKNKYDLYIIGDSVVYHKIGKARRLSCKNYFWGESSVGFVYKKHKDILLPYIPFAFIFQVFVKVPIRYLKERLCLIDLFKGALLGWIRKL